LCATYPARSFSWPVPCSRRDFPARPHLFKSSRLFVTHVEYLFCAREDLCLQRRVELPRRRIACLLSIKFARPRPRQTAKLPRRALWHRLPPIPPLSSRAHLVLFDSLLAISLRFKSVLLAPHAFTPHPSGSDGFAFSVEPSNTSSLTRSPPHQLAPDTISSSFRASARNLKSWVKTEPAAWCSPGARQKARTSCATQVRFAKIIQSRRKSSAIDYRRKEGPWMTSTRTRSHACDYRVELVGVS
jgi:hypothetical protein